jgi:ABC transport system ATP-binding/permease protein
VLVTHDRYLLDRVSTVVLGLDGKGTVERFADYSQWEAWTEERSRPKPELKAAPQPRKTSQPKKLSYLEAREFESIEQRIAEAEIDLKACHAALEDPAVVSDGRRAEAAYRELQEAQVKIDALYERWAELEAKI